MIEHYLKIAWRQILKNKTQYILSLIGIAIGLLCFGTACYYVRNDIQNYTVWENADRMGGFSTIYQESGDKTEYVSGAALQDLLDNPMAGIEKISLCDKWNEANITFVREQGETPFLCSIANVNEDFPAVYSLRTLDGGIARVRQGEALISERCAARVFGKENPVGKVLYFTKSDAEKNTVTYTTISAVVRNFPQDLEVSSDLYFLNNPVRPDRTYSAATTTVLMAPDFSVEDVNAQLSRRSMPDKGDGKKSTLRITTLYESLMQGESLLAIILVPFIASLVLVVSLINFLKLSIQTFYNRTRELCLRKSLGSGQGGLFTLLFTEQVLLLLLAVLCSFCLTEIVFSNLYRFLPEGVMPPVDTSVLMKQQLGYLVGVLLICGVISALAVRRINYINVISGIRGGNRGRHSVRNVMLGLQLVICYFFIGGGVGMMLVADRMSQGYYTLPSDVCARTWILRMFEPQLRGHEQEIISQIRALSGVEEITSIKYSSNPHFTLADSIRRSLLLDENGDNYIRFMRLPIQGRYPAEGEVVVSKALKELLDQVQPDNADRLLVNNRSYLIAGTYERLPFNQLKTKHMYSAITLFENSDECEFYVKCADGQGDKVREEILAIIRKRLPDTIPFSMYSLEEKIDLGYGGANFMGTLFLVLSVVCLLITTLGIYSAITLDTHRRQKEVAIRKINGAGAKTILLLFGRLYLRLLGISALIAFPILYFILTQITGGMVSENAMQMYGPLFWLSILLIVGLVVALTIGWRLWGILRLNPAEVIKSE